MKPRSKLPALLAAASLAATGLAIGPLSSTAGAQEPIARPSAPGKPKVLQIKSSEKRVTVSDQRFRPGVTELRVVRTAHRGSSMILFQTDNLDRLFKEFGKAGQSADAMKTVDRIATFYGGGGEGTRWQVKLGQGQYYIIDGKTNKLTTITVKGERRGAKMVRPDSEVWTTKQNQFETSGKLSGKWVSFTNKSREIHFLEADHVADSTTSTDVRQGLKSQQDPKWLRPGGFFFDIQSPGIKTVHRQDVRSQKYLLMCWMPSEEQDGVPHAMMGMWRLVQGA